MTCIYRKACKNLNKKYKRHHYCLNLIYECLNDYRWKERIIYKITPHQEDWDKSEISLQIKNPLNYFNSSKCDLNKDKSIYIPISYWEKPLLFDVDVSVHSNGLKRELVIPSRFEAGIALARIFVTRFRFLREVVSMAVKNGLREYDVINYVASLLICSGKSEIGVKDANPEYYLRKLYSYFNKVEDISYVTPQIRQYFSYLKEKKRDLSELDFDDLYDINISDEEIDNAILSNKVDIGNVDEYIELLYNDFVTNRIQLTQIVSDSTALFNPYLGIIDYFYLVKEHNEFSFNAEIKKYTKLTEVYTKLLLYQVRSLLIEETILYKDSLLIKEILGLYTFFTDSFVILASIPTSSDKFVVKMKFTAKSLRKNGTFRYPINISIAKSVHFEIVSQDLGYKIAKIKTEPQRFFWGRVFYNKNLAHVSTRKKSIVAPYWGQNSFRDNLVFNDSICILSVKYRLSDFLKAIFTLLSLVLSLCLFFVKDSTTILFFAVLPIIVVMISMFGIGKWSLTHFLLRKYKYLFVILFLLLFLKYFIKTTTIYREMGILEKILDNLVSLFDNVIKVGTNIIKHIVTTIKDGLF